MGKRKDVRFTMFEIPVLLKILFLNHVEHEKNITNSFLCFNKRINASSRNLLLHLLYHLHYWIEYHQRHMLTFAARRVLS